MGNFNLSHSSLPMLVCINRVSNCRFNCVICDKEVYSNYYELTIVHGDRSTFKTICSDCRGFIREGL